MSDVMETKCPKALLQRKILWCGNLDNFCLYQQHCRRKGHAILTAGAKKCKYRESKP